LVLIREPKGEWEHWSNRIGGFVYPENGNIDFGSMLVPNVDSVRIEYLLSVVAKQGKVSWTGCYSFL